MCKSKLNFCLLFEKLTKSCVVTENDKLVRQVKECPMGLLYLLSCLIFTLTDWKKVV